MPDPLDKTPPSLQFWSTQRLLPEGFLPMLPVTASGPLDSPEYGYEVKWEGLRLLAGCEGKELVAQTGTGQDARFWFPELTQIRAAAEPRWVLLDGEIVQRNGDRIDPVGLQRRLQPRDSDDVIQLAAELPVAFMVYDILRIGDSWLLDVSWEERRDILLRAVSDTPAIRISPAFPTGEDALRQARRCGLEAVLAKRLRGRYVPGEKTRDWLSVKPLEEQDAVICGWIEGRGARAGAIGSLILGVRSGARLIYAGHTGTGIDAQTLRGLYEALVARGVSDPSLENAPELGPQVHWTRPDLVCRVRHHGWTEAAHMRGPTFVALLGSEAHSLIGDSVRP
jgi:bifunctional non-homologous end joining protein LigD